MEKLYICYATSDEYCGYTGISLLSLLMNNDSKKFGEIFILDYGITSNNKVKLVSVANKYNVHLTFIDAAPILEGLRLTMGLEDFAGSLATYSRAFIDHLIPEYVNKLLYIDSDTIIIDSICDVVSINMGEAAIAGTIGVNQYRYEKEKPNPELNLLTKNNMYIACGIVFYELSNWRKYNCNEYIAKTCRTGMSFRHADQSLINNAIPENMMIPLPLKYNYWGHCFPKRRERYELQRGNWYDDKEISGAIEAPIIIHYKGLYYRPWYNGCISRMANEYQKYKSLSPWKDIPQRTLKSVINEMPKESRIHLRYGLVCEKVPYKWMYDFLIGFKRMISKRK